jgi:predicted CXXCH cytochrome family protein
MRSKVFLCSPVILGLFGVAICSPQQNANPANPRATLPQNAFSQNSSYGVWGEDQLLTQNRSAAKAGNSVTLLDEIDDPGERKAYVALFYKQNAPDRRKTALEFIQQYPQSWFLSQAYDVAAKASIDLGDNKSAIQFGRESLRLLPENPLLLVPLADVETQEGNSAGATQDARLALNCLDRFLRPSIYSEKEWTALERQLRATSYYILGKATIRQGLDASGPARDRKLQEAEEFTSKSFQLNPSDTAAVYLLGLIRLARGNLEGAAIAFATTWRQEGPLKQKAGEHLQTIYAHWPSKPAQGFDAFVRDLAAADVPAQEPESGEESTPASAPAPPYAGSQSCQSCHPREYSGWLNTGHARMFRPYKFENVFGDFDNATYADETGKVVARFTHDETQHYIDIMDNYGKWYHYRVDYTIGSKWQQTYAIGLPDGEIQVVPLQYNRDKKVWSAFWKMIDPPNSERAQVTNFPRLSQETAYLAHCGPCHTSQLRSTITKSPQAKDLVIAEGGINCEMCHGPSGEHVASMRLAKPGYKPPLKLQVEFGKVSSRDYVAICGQCHLQSTVLTMGPEGEINYRHFPDTFYVHYRSRPYGEFALRSFYKDGRFRVVSFIVESFLRSKCYQQGQAQCGHCHDFHPSDSSNIRALKFRDNPDQMCLQCHPEYAAQLVAHTHHAAQSEGSRCTACHMPKIMTSVMFKTMTHQLDDIPNAEMTARYGQDNSPNACFICHKDKDIAWLKAELSKWKGSEGRTIAASGARASSQ